VKDLLPRDDKYESKKDKEIPTDWVKLCWTNPKRFKQMKRDQVTQEHKALISEIQCL